MERPPVISVASGKGGTGKTTVAVNLAALLADRGRRVQLFDCDVEEPNCHIFVRPEIDSSEAVHVPVPEVDQDACTLCGECGRVCQFHAIAVLKTTVLTFPELCHGCSGCWRACPVGAIRPGAREVGVVEAGTAAGGGFAQGRMRVGEAMAPPLIRAVKKHLDREATVILDAPPGTSCPVIEAVRGSDLVVLVTEPTPFGLNDLRLAVEMVRALGLPHGVVVNRSGIGDDRVQRYCADEGVKLLAELPDDRRAAEAYSRGELLVRARPEWRDRFAALWSTIEARLGGPQ